MDCSEFLRRYSEYDDSLIGGRELDRFQSHLAACTSCARYDRVLRKGRMLARQLPRPVPADDFGLRLHWRLRQLRRRGPARGLARIRSGSELAAALAAVTLLLGGLSAIGVLALSGSSSPVERVRLALAEPPPGSGGSAVAGAGEAWRGRGVPVRVLPPLQSAGPTERRPWGVERVDPGVGSSYSPLVIGPPSYRVAATIPPTGTASRRRPPD